jgi:hypothetical protein
MISQRNVIVLIYNVEESRRDLVWGIIQAKAWKDWVKHQRNRNDSRATANAHLFTDFIRQHSVATQRNTQLTNNIELFADEFNDYSINLHLLIKQHC